MPKEICPVCAEKGDKSPKEVKVSTGKGRETKKFSCGHGIIKIATTEAIRVRDKVEVEHIKKSLKQE